MVPYWPCQVLLRSHKVVIDNAAVTERHSIISRCRRCIAEIEEYRIGSRWIVAAKCLDRNGQDIGRDRCNQRSVYHTQTECGLSRNQIFDKRRNTMDTCGMVVKLTFAVVT